ncbi:MAG TPA: twin-arginine translocation signal domain-containing protein [Candidatus Acidoferrales bacterium]|nr:twin-arginine translocation signal domain-containing protein [Candidatus Acidoferrales bacterium]
MKRKKTNKPLSVEKNSFSRRDFLKLAGAGAAMLSLPGSASAGIFSGPCFNFKKLAQTHDLPSLSDWGPYSKKHFGISHIPDVQRGLSFDFSVFPLLTDPSAKKQLPSVTEASGVHPWEAAPDMGYYSMRFETIWKDQFYTDISYSQLSDNSRLMRLECVNQTGAPQQITLNYLSQLVFPPLHESSAEPIRLCDVQLPTGAVWVHALDYFDLRYALSRPTDNLVPDGQLRGEERRHDCVGGSVIAHGFGMDVGDTVIYRSLLKESFSNATLIWRLQMDKGESATFQMTGTVNGETTFHGGEGFSVVAVPLGKLDAGELNLRFISRGGAAVALNGFVLVESGQANNVRFVEKPWRPEPKIEALPNGLILKYDDVPNVYGFAIGVPMAGHRELKWSGLDAALGTEMASDSFTRVRIFGDRRRGHAGDPDSLFIHAASQPLTVPPQSTQMIYGLICTGSEDEVRRNLTRFDPQASRHEKIYRAARKSAFKIATTPAGKDFILGQQLMAAVTLSNLVYPIYTQRSYIRHYSPGRIWDCLYTWDAGFIGLGLAELDLQNAVEILNAYLTPAGAQSAFIHHGSPVPVQIYLFWELWNRTQSGELLAYFYPRLRQYHAFLAGRLGSSTTRRHRDNLICTWDYFYNSGGWDDYPPQKYIHAQNLEGSAAPVINSAHTIRCAKILRAAAAALGRTADFAEYDDDIATLSASLQKYSWDESSGYFGYVMHDDRGEPTGILRHESGANFDMGMDGAYPLVAGICSAAQEQQILDHLFSPQHLWMDIGITTVDQSAPYYSPIGYWNGSVWLAHQWFFWKTMLDLGRGDLAIRIARAGLDVWKKVTDSTYDCMEHFEPREPVGAGWCQFSSLSSPALSWFASLFTPGRFTCGFNVWVQSCEFGWNNRGLRAELKPANGVGRDCSVLACMNPDSSYRATWNGQVVTVTSPHEGLLQIQLPAGTGELRIEAIG